MAPRNSGFGKENKFLRVYKVLENKEVPPNMDHYN